MSMFLDILNEPTNGMFQSILVKINIVKYFGDKRCIFYINVLFFIDFP